MASSALSPPGEPFGPCLEGCTHIDCAATRKQAESPCAICGDPIGYDRHFYKSSDGIQLEHYVCAEEKLEEKRKQKE